MTDSVSSDEEEELYSMYDTKTVCNRFNSQLQQMKTQLRKNLNKTNNIPKNAPANEKAEEVNPPRKKNLAQEKNGISKNSVSSTQEVKKKNPYQENVNSDTDDSVESIEESEDESSRIRERQRNDEAMFELSARPPACSTRSQKKLVTSNQTSTKNSPVKKKKRGTIESYFKPVNTDIVISDEEELEIISIEDEDEKEEEDEVNFEVSVKVLWKSTNVRRFTLRKFQKFSNIFEQIMKEENVSSDKIIFTLKGQRVKPTDTPESLNLQVYDIIDGGILSKASNNFNNTNAEENEVDDSTMVTVKFQDNSKKTVKLRLKKTDKIKIVLLKYSEQMEVPLDKIKFVFDGENLDPTETPISLGLESEDVIDVTFLN